MPAEARHHYYDTASILSVGGEDYDYVDVDGVPDADRADETKPTGKKN